MKTLLLTSLIATTTMACPNWAPCLLIEKPNEELMAHEYGRRQSEQRVEMHYSQPNLMNFVRPMIGIPYKFGGESEYGIDCSAFSRKLYKYLGVFLPRTSRSQYRDDRFKDVSFEKLRTWDLIFFKKTLNHPISHVAIYLGNGKIAHSSKREGGVYITNLNKGSYWTKIAFAAKRLKGEYL